MKPRILLATLSFAALTLVACGGEAPVATPGTAAAAEGKRLFEGRFNCQQCHPNGNRGVGRALVGEEFQQRHPTDETVVRQVRSGGKGMPAFPPSVMTNDQLAEVVAYVRWLNEQEAAQ